MSCPECEAEKAVYGFVLKKNCEYMTKLKEIRTCCPVKVKVIDFDSLTVKMTYRDKEFIMPKKQFMTTSWRVYDSY